jgi:micrococcal nuclease
VDTPEVARPDRPAQHYAPHASRFARQAALHRRVRLELDPQRTRGVYGRLLAYVHLPDGRMLNRILIAEGYGYADPRFPHRLRRQFRRLQRQAMQDRRGLWRDVRAVDLPHYCRDLELPPATAPAGP